MKRNIIIISLVLFISISFVVINEINTRPKLNLVKDAKKIKEVLENTKRNGHEEIIINDGYKINDKKYNVKGYGVIFLESDYSFFLQRDGMCVMKMIYSDDIMFQDTPCPEYRMVRQFKLPLDEEFYKLGDSYYFRGKNPKNYIVYNNELYRILELNKNYIRIISSSFIDDGKISDAIYKKTLYKNKSFIIKNKNYEIITLENVIYKNGEGKIENPYEVEDI